MAFLQVLHSPSASPVQTSWCWLRNANLNAYPSVWCFKFDPKEEAAFPATFICKGDTNLVVAECHEADDSSQRILSEEQALCGVVKWSREKSVCLLERAHVRGTVLWWCVCMSASALQLHLQDRHRSRLSRSEKDRKTGKCCHLQVWSPQRLSPSAEDITGFT